MDIGHARVSTAAQIVRILRHDEENRRLFFLARAVFLGWQCGGKDYLLPAIQQCDAGRARRCAPAVAEVRDCIGALVDLEQYIISDSWDRICLACSSVAR